MKKTTAEKQRLKRKGIRKIVRFSRVFALKGTRTTEQVKAGADYEARHEAMKKKISKIQAEAKARKEAKKGNKK